MRMKTRRWKVPLETQMSEEQLSLKDPMALQQHRVLNVQHSRQLINVLRGSPEKDLAMAASNLNQGQGIAIAAHPGAMAAQIVSSQINVTKRLAWVRVTNNSGMVRATTN